MKVYRVTLPATGGLFENHASNMHVLHTQLREKRELHYETRHLVGGVLGLAVFGLATFYIGLLVGERNGATGRFHDPQRVLGRLLDQAMVGGQPDLLAEGSRNSAREFAEKLPLLHVDRLGVGIPARVPVRRAAQKVTSRGPVPLDRAGLVPRQDDDATVEVAEEHLTPMEAVHRRKQVVERGRKVAEEVESDVHEQDRARPLALALAVFAKAEEPASPKPRPSRPLDAWEDRVLVRKTLAQVAPAHVAPALSGMTVTQPVGEGFTLQIHAFKDGDMAQEIARALGIFQGDEAQVARFRKRAQTWYRVHIGRFASLAEARSYQQAFEAERGLADTFPVPL